jgi:hypothetical protein
MPSRSRVFVCCGSEERQKAGMSPWQSKTGGNLRHKHRSKLSEVVSKLTVLCVASQFCVDVPIKNPAFSWRNKQGRAWCYRYVPQQQSRQGCLQQNSRIRSWGSVGVAGQSSSRARDAWIVADAHMQMQMHTTYSYLCRVNVPRFPLPHPGAATMESPIRRQFPDNVRDRIHCRASMR